jgi:hypothetical protein
VFEALRFRFRSFLFGNVRRFGARAFGRIAFLLLGSGDADIAERRADELVDRDQVILRSFASLGFSSVGTGETDEHSRCKRGATLRGFVR